MSRRTARQALRPGLHEDPAVQAWAVLNRSSLQPKEVHVLKQAAKSAVYRIAGVGPNGSAVIAKRCKRDVAIHESIIYEEILPYLPVSSLRCYGCVDDPDTEHLWLFLEDAGGEAYCRSHEHHRLLATRWLALMHVTAPQVAAAASLPPRGPGWYLEHLRSAREVLLSAVADPTFDSDDTAVLQRAAAQLDALEARWDEIEQVCAVIAPTLVHGDFVSKNVGIGYDQHSTILLPFDWEMAGRGTLAADLEAVDIDAYYDTVCIYWPDLTLPDLRRLACAGHIFRWTAAMAWQAQDLPLATDKAAEWVRWRIASFDRCSREIANGLVSGLVRCNVHAHYTV